MTSTREYSAEENFRRIKRQKKLSFVVVEGSDDVPIYESCLSAMLDKGEDFDVIFSGGKTAIKEFLVSNQNTNAIFLVDKDFNDVGLVDNRLISLSRYSIENYFICEEVISYSLQFALNCKFKDARDAFSLDEYVESITASVQTLIKVLFYYQRCICPSLVGQQKVAWSEAFLCENNSWRLCDAKIQELIDQLIPDPDVLALVEAYYIDNFDFSENTIEDFPGKMLRHSLQRYIRHKVLELRPKAKGKYNDVETTRTLLSSVMHRSSKMIDLLEPVARFINSRASAN
ncbi:hypothetical protein M2399_002064 [Pseudomonas sp. BIGb0450]|uniref:DUF4435 domain-containing protein n=1 Tax=unclassified Pseudomonas TaxID=196821 RepID=UPI002166F4BF|nr:MULTISPECIES: DUF4435 domain-containing protein [unclassified Pseudomonas]MCS3417024.1 hypothetical protein [Pseudomonas sp. BIGb0558]MCS3436631.1 hypothetical protein [Pseudomonas sp. BIGb0450]